MGDRNINFHDYDAVSSVSGGTTFENRINCYDDPLPIYSGDFSGSPKFVDGDLLCPWTKLMDFDKELLDLILPTNDIIVNDSPSTLIVDAPSITNKNTSTYDSSLCSSSSSSSSSSSNSTISCKKVSHSSNFIGNIKDSNSFNTAFKSSITTITHFKPSKLSNDSSLCDNEPPMVHGSDNFSIDGSTPNNVKSYTIKNKIGNSDDKKKRVREGSSPNYGNWSNDLVTSLVDQYKLHHNSWSLYKIENRTTQQIMCKGQQLVKKALEKYGPSLPCEHSQINDKLIAYNHWYWSDDGKKERNRESQFKRKQKKI